jgi:hypothetical protein
VKTILFAALAALAVPVSALAQSDIWQFNETSGATAVNGVSGRPDGTLSAGASRVPGVSGNAVYTPPFEKVDFTTATGQFGTGDFTVSFWVKSSNTNFAEMLGNRGAYGSCGSYVDFRAGSNGTVSLELTQDEGCTGYIALQSTTAVNDGNWHRIVGVRSGVTATLYVDGVAEATASSSDSVVANIQSPFSFTAGANENTSIYGIPFNGTFDDVTLYNQALTAFDFATPADKITAIQSAVQGYGLEAGIANSVISKLNAALADAASGDTDSAAGVLGALANQVSAQRGKKLTVAQADALLALIEATRASL